MLQVKLCWYHGFLLAFSIFLPTPNHGSVYLSSLRLVLLIARVRLCQARSACELVSVHHSSREGDIKIFCAVPVSSRYGQVELDPPRLSLRSNRFELLALISQGEAQYKESNKTSSSALLSSLLLSVFFPTPNLGSVWLSPLR